MIRLAYKGYWIVDSNTGRGGKAGRNKNKTASIQVQEPMPNGYCLKKQFKYRVDDDDDKVKSIQKAREYVETLL